MRINSVTLWASPPDAEHLAEALRAISGYDRQFLWVPMTGSAGDGRVCRINLPPTGAAFIEVVESSSGYTAVPEQLALWLDGDYGSVIERLRVAGFTVDDGMEDDVVRGSVLVAGMRILLVDAG